MNFAIGSKITERSPERTKLAELIERRDAEAKHIAAIQKTEKDLFDKTIKMRQEVERAREQIETAKKAAGQHLTDMALGNESIAPQTVKDARKGLQESEDELESILIAREALTARLAQANEEFSRLEIAIGNAIREVIKSDPAIAALKPAYDKAYLEFSKLRDVFQLLWAQAPHWSYLPSDVTCGLPKHVDGAEIWRRAMKELSSNADEPLPAILP